MFSTHTAFSTFAVRQRNAGDKCSTTTSLTSHQCHIMVLWFVIIIFNIRFNILTHHKIICVQSLILFFIKAFFPDISNWRHPCFPHSSSGKWGSSVLRASAGLWRDLLNILKSLWITWMFFFPLSVLLKAFLIAVRAGSYRSSRFRFSRNILNVCVISFHSSPLSFLYFSLNGNPPH